ncbi:(2Fe-2S)-binding protein [Kitasatospora aureofaciens]|uniref:(2Fe-2S)-binding protein n=1 Tax=Kitasatospora aureofaciens TaxID=1894 RepID=UPI0036F45513
MQPMPGGKASGPATTLREVSRIGPYFAIHVGDPDAPPPPGYRPLRDLYRSGPDAILGQKITELGRRLRTDERRVAASTLFLGLAARLWSIALGAAALAGTVPDLHPDRTHWHLPPQGPADLWITTPEQAAEAALPDALHRVVVQHNLAPLLAATRASTPIAERLLWGNAASALAGALRVLHHAAPSAAPAADHLAQDLLSRAPLAGSGTLTTAPGLPPAFRRTTCCLYYRTPGAGLCVDCVLTTPPRHRIRHSPKSETTP